MTKHITLFLVLVLVKITTLFAQVPTLNSNPGAGPTLFLDFDGQTVQTTYWNGGTAFYATPYAFTSDQINTMFKMVAEDFRPFQMNVTTDSAVYFAAPANRRQRMIITTYSSWYGNAGGVAYTGSFRWGLEIPAFVFSNLLGNNFKYVAEAISHEAGHTLGLQHQSSYDANCSFVSEYNSGRGSGEIGWAPIMGVGYQRNLTLWHSGSSSFGCTSIQNDLSLIASTSNGIVYRTDDVGNTLQESAAIILNGSNYSINGFINNTNDVDVFNCTISERGQFTLNAIPFNTGNNGTSANIDMKVDLLSSTGNLLRSFNPSVQLASLVDTTLDAGSYYIRISNIGNVNVGNYGMLGSYALTGTFTGGASTGGSGGGSGGGGGTTPLPVESVMLSGRVRNKQHELQWSIVANEPIAYASLQRSLDGRTFTELFRTSTGATSYTYQPQENTILYYRLMAVTASNLQYPSNIISMKSSAKPARAATLTTNQFSNEITWMSNAASDWRLMNASGLMVLKGRFSIGFNQIQTGHLPAGVYILQIVEGGEIRSTKMMKY